MHHSIRDAPVSSFSAACANRSRIPKGPGLVVRDRSHLFLAANAGGFVATATSLYRLCGFSRSLTSRLGIGPRVQCRRTVGSGREATPKTYREVADHNMGASAPHADRGCEAAVMPRLVPRASACLLTRSLHQACEQDAPPVRRWGQTIREKKNTLAPLRGPAEVPCPMRRGADETERPPTRAVSNPHCATEVAKIEIGAAIALRWARVCSKCRHLA